MCLVWIYLVKWTDEQGACLEGWYGKRGPQAGLLFQSNVEPC